MLPTLLTRIFFTILTVLLFTTTPSYSQRWDRVPIDEPYNSNYWLDVFFLPTNANLGWVCGYNGMVIRTVDAGLTWKGSNVDDVKKPQLESIHFPTQSVGYTSGSKNIYRTANGGASWQEVTPSGVVSLWGCYFVSSNVGMVIGSGCGATKQQFFRTTDGGTSWSETRDSVPNSGLTDLILNSSTGLGYAVGSGWLWRTLDLGITWQTFMPTGQQIWHEEITNVKNSFLLPFSGTTCAGAGNGGGMRFSTNNGSDWTNYITPDHNYGAFLLSDSSGWVCGLNSQMYYTSNYGQTWELRNCGISTDLDDTYFINDTTGWVVGKGAIYHLTAPFRSVNKSSVNYGDACFPGVKNDTLYVKISSFFQSYGTIQLTGDNPEEFRIIQPGTSFIAPACDSMRIIIQFRPTTDGTKNAVAEIRLSNPSIVFSVPLVGKTKRISSFAATDTLLFKSAPCGIVTIDSLRFKNPSADTEQVVKVDRLTQNNPLMLFSPLPLVLLPKDSNSLKFQVVPIDTGWITTYHLAWLGVCNKVLTVRAFGTSPIINAPPTRTILLNCNTYMFDTVMISNTGNKPLLIPTLRVFGTDSSDFKIVGFTGGNTLPLSIDPQKSIGVIVRFGPVAAGQQKNAVIRIENNDSTSIRGHMNPFDVSLIGVLGSSILSISDTVVNCGDICVNSTKQFKFKIKNIGSAPAKITAFTNSERTFSFSASVGAEVKQVDSLTITIFAMPEREGIIRDTLHFTLDPCGEKFSVALNCNGVKTSLEAIPTEIRETIQSGRAVKRSIIVKSTGSAPAVISSITLTPARPDWKLTDIPPLPDTLANGKQLTVNVEFNATDDALFDGKVCFNASQTCPTQICVPIQVQSIASRLGFSVSELDFGDSKCILPNSRRTLTITNEGTVTDTVNVVLLRGNPVFTLLTPTTLEIPGGGSSNVEVEYKPTTEGVQQGELSIWSVKQDTVRLSVPMHGSFARTNTTASSKISQRTYEPCDLPVKDTVTFTNTGTLTDTITITANSVISGFEIFPTDKIILPPGTTRIAIITTTPSAFPTVGIYSQSYKFTFDCSGLFDVPIACRIIHPMLIISPVSINFGNISLGDTSSRVITISNPTTIDKNIIELKQLTGAPDFIIDTPSLPFTVPAGGLSLLSIRFVASAQGNSKGLIRLIEESVCRDTTAIDMQADVFYERFKARVVIDNYSAQYGEILSIPLRLEQSLLSAEIQKLTSEIQFDGKLLAILSVSFDGDTIPFTYHDGVLTVEQVASQNTILGAQGAVFTIKALTLLSAPDTTTLHIRQFTVQARKDTEIEKKDGFLNVDDGCHIAIGLSTIPTLTTRIVSPIPALNDITIELQSTSEQSAKITLTDIMGETRLSTSTHVHRIPTEFTLPINELPAGMYFLSVSSLGKTFREKIIVVK